MPVCDLQCAVAVSGAWFSRGRGWLIEGLTRAPAEHIDGGFAAPHKAHSPLPHSPNAPGWCSIKGGGLRDSLFRGSQQKAQAAADHSALFGTTVAKTAWLQLSEQAVRLARGALLYTPLVSCEP
jgi:hypothetical protein